MNEKANPWPNSREFDEWFFTQAQERPGQSPFSRDSADTSPPAVAFNFRVVLKKTLRGWFNIELPSGLILIGCSLHERNGRFWTGLPGRPYETSDGERAWANVVGFRDKERRDRFQMIATAAATKAYREAAA